MEEERTRNWSPLKPEDQEREKYLLIYEDPLGKGVVRKNYTATPEEIRDISDSNESLGIKTYFLRNPGEGHKKIVDEHSNGGRVENVRNLIKKLGLN